MGTTLASLVAAAERLALERSVRAAETAAAAAKELGAGLEARVEDGRVVVRGRGIRQRWLRGEARLLTWAEEARHLARRAR